VQNLDVPLAGGLVGCQAGGAPAAGGGAGGEGRGGRGPQHDHVALVPNMTQPAGLPPAKGSLDLQAGEHRRLGSGTEVIGGGGGASCWTTATA